MGSMLFSNHYCIHNFGLTFFIGKDFIQTYESAGNPEVRTRIKRLNFRTRDLHHNYHFHETSFQIDCLNIYFITNTL